MKTAVHDFGIGLGILAVSMNAVVALAGALPIAGWTAAQAAGSGTTYYVSTTGNDANAGTADAPFRTLDFARRRLAPGDTLRIYGGTYHEKLLLENSGSASQPITVTAVEGQEVILDTPALTSQNINVEITGSYNLVTKIEVRNSRWSCVVIRGTNNTVTHLIVDGCVSHGIIASGTNIRVENSEIFNTVRENAARTDGSGWGSALKVERDADYVTFMRNKIYHNFGEGVGITMGNHVTAADNFVFDNFSVNIYVDNSSNVTIERNLSSCTDDTRYLRNGNRPAGIALAEEYYSGWGNRLTNIVVRNNIVGYCGAGIAYWGADQGLGGMNNILIEHNTFYGGTRGVLYVADETTNTREARVTNNIFGTPADSGPWVDEPMRPLVAFQSNFWVDILPASTTGALGTGDKAGDPGFVTTPTYNIPESFALSPSSGAQGTGADTSQFGSNASHGFGAVPTPGPAPAFADVPLDHPYREEIERLYQAGYTAGCNINPLRYCPEQVMNRAESAVFVERGIHAATYDPAAPASQAFADLPLDSWAAKWVNGLWVDQYTAGCGTNPLVYCPWQGHTRAEGCVLYLRMLNGADFDPPQPAGQTFSDVPLDSWYGKWVQAAYDAGLIPPCQTSPELRFCPDAPLSRGLAAFMMVQAKGLTLP